jgi:putative FmdB family regulatory protein
MCLSILIYEEITMPIYEYKCQSCHRTLEFIQKFSDPLRTECPNCHGKLDKLLSSTSFQLKGTGWYATDFKNADKKPEENPKPSEEAKPSKETKETSAPSTDKESGKAQNPPSTTSTTSTGE